jgi:N6-adenosine-specific RNA methylase IME4
MLNSSPTSDSKAAPVSLWAPLPPGPFDLAYLDCPWRWVTWTPAGDGKAPPYGREALWRLKTLPLRSILAPDAAVAMWVIDTHLEQAFELASTWRLKFSTRLFCWAKTTKHGKWHFGTGKTTRANPEDCWLFWRGDGLRIRDHAVPRLIVSQVREHSRKPDEARERLERLFGDVRRVELFARERAPGWEAWGDQVG